MKVYSCKNCQNLLYFENSLCISCQHPVGFDSGKGYMITLEKVETVAPPVAAAPVVGTNPAAPVAGTNPGTNAAPTANAAPAAAPVANLTASATPAPTAPPATTTGIAAAPAPPPAPAPAATTTGTAAAPAPPPAPAPALASSTIYADVTDKKILYRYCQNADYGTCNWLIPTDQVVPYCQACQLNRIIPPLGADPKMLDRWKRIEVAKHRLVYSLLRLKLPVLPKTEADEANGIAFDFMADLGDGQRIMTGHDNGVITLNIEEADEAERAKNKMDLGERYRTLLGHFRHEIGHYYWDQLIANDPSIEGFRLLFGDDRKDYGEALKTYYETGAPEDWMNHFISPYASAHPWEDWAETWAHYMHLMDTLETAYSFGISIHPVKTDELDADISKDPYAIKDFHKIIEMWLPLTFAVNSLNRSMGHGDFYPFVISAEVIQKLRFIHERVNTRVAPAKKAAAVEAAA